MKSERAAKVGPCVNTGGSCGLDVYRVIKSGLPVSKQNCRECASPLDYTHCVFVAMGSKIKKSDLSGRSHAI
jgi:hypothetical protein